MDKCPQCKGHTAGLVYPERICTSCGCKFDSIQLATTGIIKSVERDWGTYEVLGQGERWLTKRLTFNKNATMSEQRHSKRNEVWLVVAGYGTLVIDDLVHFLSVGDLAKVRPDQWHKFHTGHHGCTVIETWLGDDLRELDIERRAEG